jgi:hypothetical protein
MSPPAFSENTAENLLVKSKRYCCLCQKYCGTKIVLHHIDQNGGNEEDNGIPLCLDCHADVNSYNINHPIGRKFKFRELKRRRDDFFEFIAQGNVPNNLDIIKRTSKPSMKHSKHLLSVLYGSSDYRDIRSMLTHTEFIIAHKDETRSFEHLLKHLETGYKNKIYVPLMRYMQIVEEYRIESYGIPFYFDDNAPTKITNELVELRPYLGEVIGELIEDVYGHGNLIKGWCMKCT